MAEYGLARGAATGIAKTEPHTRTHTRARIQTWGAREEATCYLPARPSVGRFLAGDGLLPQARPRRAATGAYIPASQCLSNPALMLGNREFDNIYRGATVYNIFEIVFLLCLFS